MYLARACGMHGWYGITHGSRLCRCGLFAVLRAKGKMERPRRAPLPMLTYVAVY